MFQDFLHLKNSGKWFQSHLNTEQADKATERMQFLQTVAHPAGRQVPRFRLPQALVHPCS